MAFEVYGTKGAIAWNLEQLNELRVYLVDDDARAAWLHDRVRRRPLPVPRPLRARATPTPSASRTSSRSRTTRSSTRWPRASSTSPASTRRSTTSPSRRRGCARASRALGRRDSHWRSRRENRSLHDGAGDRALPDRPADRHRRLAAAAVPRRLRHLRPRQRDVPRPGAGGGARRVPDVARPERAGHGARRCRLRQGVAAPADHGRHELDRAGRHEHGHGRRRRPRQPAARAAARRRHVRLAASPTRCCSRSRTSATRRSRSTTRSSR